MNEWLSNTNLLLKDLFYTLFPDLCLACNKEPKSSKASFCIECMLEMPYTDHFFQKDNDATKHFKGRINVHHAAALLIFREGSIVQNMLHNLKYKGRKEIGEILGEIAGKKYLESVFFEIPDLIIPVPVHPKKILRRGYNQSSVFGKAVATAIGVEMRTDILVKQIWSESQTGKSRTERVANVDEVFILNIKEEISGRHVLLVDDVITTGATIESCCLKLKEGNIRKISILSIAAAK